MAKSLKKESGQISAFSSSVHIEIESILTETEIDL